MRLKFLNLIQCSALLAMAPQGLHANPAVDRTDPFAGATVISAIRTELGTPRLDAISRTLEINHLGYRIHEASLGRVLCGAVEITQPGQAPFTVGVGEQFVVTPGTVLRGQEVTSRIVVVNVIPKFDTMVP